MSKKLLIIVGTAVVLAGIGAGFWLGQSDSANTPKPDRESQYSAVYLSTGDIYFGKLDWFPWPSVRDAWFLSRTASGTSILPLNSVPWGPTGELRLNPKEIVWWTRLMESSQLAKALESQRAAAPATAPKK